MACVEGEFWTERPEMLVKNPDVIPVTGMDMGAQLNALTRSSILAALVGAFYNLKGGAMFGILSVGFIVVVYYSMKKSFDDFEGFKPDVPSGLGGATRRRNVKTDVSSLYRHEETSRNRFDSHSAPSNIRSHCSIEGSGACPKYEVVSHDQPPPERRLHPSYHSDHYPPPRAHDHSYLSSYNHDRPTIPIAYPRTRTERRVEKKKGVRTFMDAYDTAVERTDDYEMRLVNGRCGPEYTPVHHTYHPVGDTHSVGHGTREPANWNIGVSEAIQHDPSGMTFHSNEDLSHLLSDPTGVESFFHPDDVHDYYDEPSEYTVYDGRVTGNVHAPERCYHDDMTGEVRHFYDDVHAVRIPKIKHASRNHIVPGIENAKNLQHAKNMSHAHWRSSVNGMQERMMERQSRKMNRIAHARRANPMRISVANMRYVR